MLQRVARGATVYGTAPVRAGARTPSRGDCLGHRAPPCVRPALSQLDLQAQGRTGPFCRAIRARPAPPRRAGPPWRASEPKPAWRVPA